MYLRPKTFETSPLCKRQKYDTLPHITYCNSFTPAIMKNLILSILMLAFVGPTFAQLADLPDRAANAISGSEFEELIRNLPLSSRENEIYSQIMSGNVPDFQRNPVEIGFSQTVGGVSYEVSYRVLPEYLAVGSDDDYFLIPTTPMLAQRLCNQLDCMLPTRKMVDQIWAQSDVKLAPSPIPWSDASVTIPVMWQHNLTVRGQRSHTLNDHPLGALVAGHKKDVIIANRIYSNPASKPVVIYGWHYQNGNPIQPLYGGHIETYVDYSHGIRLVQDSITINGEPASLSETLQDNTLHVLFSDEGVIGTPYYPLDETSISVPNEFGVVSDGPNSLKLVLRNVADVTHYRVYLSQDGVQFDDPISVPKENPVITGLDEDMLYFAKLRAADASRQSPFSEVLGAVTGSSSAADVLVVNGFDRPITGNTFDFIRMHGPAILNAGRRFDAATNEAIATGLVSMNEYAAVSWILSAESTADETFSSLEQTRVEAYLNQGGALFVSGSEIAWDLDNRGTSNDKAFIRNYLKSEYVADAPNNQSNTFYQAEGMSGTPFDGLAPINFDNGSHGTYNVSWPDVIRGVNGGVEVIRYTGLASTNAGGVAFGGVFADGEKEGAVVVLGFPFETVYPEATRFELMSRVLGYFDGVRDVSVPQDDTPVAFTLSQNYPNPFNPVTQISYQIAENGHIRIAVFNTLGHHIETLVDGYKSTGSYSVRWDASRVASGVYVYQMQSSAGVLTKTMTLLK